MQTIGEKINAARQAKGLTLEAVQEMTKIRKRYLEAIEAGDFSIIPGEVYIKGFIVNFANAVDLDGQAILGEYYSLKKEKELQLSAEEPDTASSKASPVKELPKLQQKTPLLNPIKLPVSINPIRLVGFSLILVLLVGGFLAWTHRSSSEKQTPVAAIPINELIESDEVQYSDGGVDASTEPEPSNVNVADLRLRATEDVWIALINRATGREIEAKILKPGETREWPIHHPMVLRIGNSGGLLVSIRGGEFKYLGISGQVVSLNLSPTE